MIWLNTSPCFKISAYIKPINHDVSTNCRLDSANLVCRSPRSNRTPNYHPCETQVVINRLLQLSTLRRSILDRPRLSRISSIITQSFCSESVCVHQSETADEPGEGRDKHAALTAPCYGLEARSRVSQPTATLSCRLFHSTDEFLLSAERDSCKMKTWGIKSGWTFHLAIGWFIHQLFIPT